MCDVYCVMCAVCVRVCVCLALAMSVCDVCCAIVWFQKEQGRRSHDLLKANCASEVTMECVTGCKCKHRCFENAISGYQQTGLYTREQSVREVAHNVSLWREDLLVVKKRSNAMLQLMIECYNNTDRQYDSLKHTSSRDYLAFLPRTDIKLCVECFGVAADAADVLESGKVRRGAMYGLTLSAFNQLRNEFNYPPQSEMKDSNHFLTQEAKVWIWLKQWLPGNTDTTPFNPEKLHLEAPSKKYVYDEMVNEWKGMHREPVSYSTFIKVLGAKFKIIMHKHKKFAECQVCVCARCMGGSVCLCVCVCMYVCCVLC